MAIRTWELADESGLFRPVAVSCVPPVAGLGVHGDAHAQLGVLVVVVAPNVVLLFRGQGGDQRPRSGVVSGKREREKEKD